MPIDPTVVWETASTEERQALVIADNQARETKARTWRYAVLTVLSIIPISGVALCLNAIAGKSTKFSVSLVASIALTGLVGLAAKIQSQRRELQRLRRRIESLESDNLALRGMGGVL